MIDGKLKSQGLNYCSCSCLPTRFSLCVYYARVATKLRSMNNLPHPSLYLQGLIYNCRRITFERNKIASRLTGFIIWPDSFSIILDIVGRFRVNRSGAIGPASLRRGNHDTSSRAMFSILRSVLIAVYRRMTAMVILPWECGRHITRSGVQNRKSISRLVFGSDSDMSYYLLI